MPQRNIFKQREGGSGSEFQMLRAVQLWTTPKGVVLPFRLKKSTVRIRTTQRKLRRWTMSCKAHDFPDKRRQPRLSVLSITNRS